MSTPNVTPKVGATVPFAKVEQKGLIESIRCGGPLTRMPRYASEAKTSAAPCFGMTEDDLAKANTVPPDPPGGDAWLSDEQIERLAIYITAFYIGQDMTLEKCERYNGAGSPTCEGYED